MTTTVRVPEESWVAPAFAAPPRLATPNRPWTPDEDDDAADEAPAYYRANRAELRASRYRGHRGMPDLPWVGPIPQVGRALGQIRRAWRGRTASTRRPGPWHTPVRVDVVPVVHQRAARGAWAARWSGCTVRHPDLHRTFVPPTVVPADDDTPQDTPDVEQIRTRARRGPPVLPTSGRNVIRSPQKARAPECHLRRPHLPFRIPAHQPQNPQELRSCPIMHSRSPSGPPPTPERPTRP